MAEMKIIDITRGLKGAPLYPDSIVPTITMASERKRGAECNESILTASVHTATHADAFNHFTDSAVGIDQMDLNYYVGSCCVVEGQGVIDGLWLRNHLPKGCRRLLLKGGGAAFASADLAEALKEAGVITLGTDAWSVGPLDNELAVHSALMEAKIAILENLDLSMVKTGKYFLFAPPIKIEGADGAFVRAVLLDDFEEC